MEGLSYTLNRRAASDLSGRGDSCLVHQDYGGYDVYISKFKECNFGYCVRLDFPFQAICNSVMNFICDPTDKDNIFLLQRCLSPCFKGQQSFFFFFLGFIKAETK